jgi:hypothetical protein
MAASRVTRPGGEGVGHGGAVGYYIGFSGARHARQPPERLLRLAGMVRLSSQTLCAQLIDNPVEV